MLSSLSLGSRETSRGPDGCVLLLPGGSPAEPSPSTLGGCDAVSPNLSISPCNCPRPPRALLLFALPLTRLTDTHRTLLFLLFSTHSLPQHLVYSTQTSHTAVCLLLLFFYPKPNIPQNLWRPIFFLHSTGWVSHVDSLQPPTWNSAQRLANSLFQLLS